MGVAYVQVKWKFYNYDTKSWKLQPSEEKILYRNAAGLDQEQTAEQEPAQQLASSLKVSLS